jgi:hypothetical protein
MYTRICEENGPADPVLQGIVSTWRLLAYLVGILIERSGLQWLQITYAHTYDSDPKKYWDEGCRLGVYYGCYN